MTCDYCNKTYSKSRLKKVFTAPRISSLLCNECRWARLQRIKNGEKIYVGKLPMAGATGNRHYAMRVSKK